MEASSERFGLLWNLKEAFHRGRITDSIARVTGQSIEQAQAIDEYFPVCWLHLFQELLIGRQPDFAHPIHHANHEKGDRYLGRSRPQILHRLYAHKAIAMAAQEREKQPVVLRVWTERFRFPWLESIPILELTPASAKRFIQ
jgi:hypothetical protein